mgnify:CR=1 FL=1
MPATKIHCDFFEVFGPDWENLTQEQVDCMLNRIQSTVMFGDQRDVHGFMGTARIDNVVGGFYAVQHEDRRYYREDGEFKVVTDTPLATLFFIFYAKSGKLVLQNKTFPDTPLNMSRVQRLLRIALNEIFSECGVGITIGLYLPDSEISNERFVEEFQNSQQVLQIVVTDINPDRIPDGFVYYNPQKERNEIIRESHRHDYRNFRKVNLESTEDGDIRSTHIGKDLIISGKPQQMEYRRDGQKRLLKRQVTRKIEIYVDTSDPIIDEDSLSHLLEFLAQDASLDVARPTRIHPPDSQPSLFDDLDGENNG